MIAARTAASSFVTPRANEATSGAPGSIGASRSKIDEQAQAELASDLFEPFDDTVHSHSDKLEKLSAMDFGAYSKVEEGAVVKLDGRTFVIAVSTGKFVCEGNEMMGVSIQEPIYAELDGKRASDAISFNGKELVIEEVA